MLRDSQLQTRSSCAPVSARFWITRLIRQEVESLAILDYEYAGQGQTKSGQGRDRVPRREARSAARLVAGAV